MNESVVAQVTVAHEAYFLFVRWTGEYHELVWRDQEGINVGESFFEFTSGSVSDLEKQLGV